MNRLIDTRILEMNFDIRTIVVDGVIMDYPLKNKVKRRF